MTRKKRERITGRQQSGARYALVDEQVMNSDAYSALPDYARTVLFAIACGAHHGNNGNLSLVFAEAKTRGIRYQWKLYAGLRLLELANLLIRTRQGHLENGRKLCSLYALTWRGISPPPPGVSYDGEIGPCPLPSNAWARWKPPANWAETVRRIARENHGQTKNPVSTTGGAMKAVSLNRKVSGVAQPEGDTGDPAVAQPEGETSKTSGSRVAQLGDRRSTSQLNPDSPRSRVHKPGRSNSNADELCSEGVAS
jgi:hypothetical protein